MWPLGSWINGALLWPVTFFAFFSTNCSPKKTENTFLCLSVVSKNIKNIYILFTERCTDIWRKGLMRYFYERIWNNAVILIYISNIQMRSKCPPQYIDMKNKYKGNVLGCDRHPAPHPSLLSWTSVNHNWLSLGHNIGTCLHITTHIFLFMWL